MFPLWIAYSAQVFFWNETNKEDQPCPRYV